MPPAVVRGSSSYGVLDIESEQLDGVQAKDSLLGLVGDVGGGNLGDLMTGVEQRHVGAEQDPARPRAVNGVLDPVVRATRSAGLQIYRGHSPGRFDGVGVSPITSDISGISGSPNSGCRSRSSR